VLELIIVILVLMWLAGVALSFTAGGLIHLLLVVAVVVLLVRLIKGNPL
jgi:hypothetical protein